MNISIDNNKIATFKSTKSGRADLKKDGGVVRGRHKVSVMVKLGVNAKTLASSDLDLIKNADLDALKARISESVTFTDSDWELALYGDQPRKKGLITALTLSAEGNNDTRHLDGYSAHPIGVSGVVVKDDTGDLYIKGLAVNEEIIERDPNGDARKVKSGLHVRLKGAIEKGLNLQTRLWRQYKLPSDSSITL